MSAKKLKLTARQEAFAVEFTIDRNGRQAAIRAGYAESGASEEAYRLLRNAHVRDRVQQLLNRIAAKRNLKAQTILNRLDDVSSFDPAEAYDENGHLLGIHEMPLHIRQCIKKVTYRAEWSGSGPDRTQVSELTTVEWVDRNKANEILSKHLKIIGDDGEAAGRLADSLESLVAGANPRSRDVSPKQIEAPDDDEETDAGAD